MSSITYANLQTLVMDALEVDETTFDTHLPDFVKATEEEIFRSVQLPVLRKNSSGSMTLGNKYLSTPSDFLSVYELGIEITDNAVFRYLIRKDVSFIKSAFPGTATTGVPKFYALLDDTTFIIGPTPDTAYTTELHYYYLPTSCVTDTAAWVLTFARNALISGTIYYGYKYLKGDPTVLQGYRADFDRDITALMELGEGRNRKDSYRDGERAVPVS
jgi:hypothetical protein